MFFIWIIVDNKIKTYYLDDEHEEKSDNKWSVDLD